MKRLFLSVSLAAACAWPSAALALPKVGQPAPAFSLPTVEGKSLALSSLKGKAVYLNFYATWCPPCNQEAPDVGRLSEKYKARGLTVLGVNELESPQKAKDFLAAHHLAYTAVVDADGKVGKDYGASIGLPVHIFINRDGRIGSFRFGEMTADEIEAAIKAIL